MQVIGALANAAGAALGPDPVIEQARSQLLTCSFFILAAGILGAISSWAVFFLGFVLAAIAIWLGATLWQHTSNYEAVMNNTCCFAPSSAFSNMHTFAIITIICSCIGILISVIAIIFYSNIGQTVFVVFGVFALIGCLMALIACAFAVGPLSTIHRRLQELRPQGVVAAVVNSVAGAVAMQPVEVQHVQAYPQAQQAYPTQQAYPVGQAVAYPQQQPVYGQAQPNYGQAAPNAAPGYSQPPRGYAQQGYGQPGYGQPAYGQPAYGKTA